MKIYALVGKSGTGKSFQAVNLCKSRHIESIIDDGLFICRNKVVAGISAKRQATKVGAVKTALFYKDEHMIDVRDAIIKQQPKSLLIIGTSDGMVEKIAARLELHGIDETIRIEDITTEEQRAIADKQRHELGKHVIPAPTFQLRHQFNGYFMPPVKLLFKEWGNMREASEKSLVRPTYSYMGGYKISDKVMSDIVTCLKAENENIAEVLKATFMQVPEGLDIEMVVNLKYGVPIVKQARSFQNTVINTIQTMTSFNVISFNMEINDLV